MNTCYQVYAHARARDNPAVDVCECESVFKNRNSWLIQANFAIFYIISGASVAIKQSRQSDDYNSSHKSGARSREHKCYTIE